MEGNIQDLTATEKLRLRGIISRINTGDLPNKPNGEEIENMTDRYIAYSQWQDNEAYEIIHKFILDLFENRRRE